jgi:hypothetical protein
MDWRCRPLADIRDDLAQFGVDFEQWYSDARWRATAPSIAHWRDWATATAVSQG